jgi:hypothetical protein
LIEVILGLCILYIPGVNIAFSVRPIKIQHVLPATSFYAVILFWDELRKYLIRNIKSPDGSHGWFYEYFFY